MGEPLAPKNGGELLQMFSARISINEATLMYDAYRVLPTAGLMCLGSMLRVTTIPEPPTTT